jgi:hypothetical protein
MLKLFDVAGRPPHLRNDLSVLKDWEIKAKLGVEQALSKGRAVIDRLARELRPGQGERVEFPCCFMLEDSPSNVDRTEPVVLHNGQLQAIAKQLSAYAEGKDLEVTGEGIDHIAVERPFKMQNGK